jgi:hypothetical protein
MRGLLLLAVLACGLCDAQTPWPEERARLKAKIEEADNVIEKELRTSGFPCDKFIGSSDTLGEGKQVYACITQVATGRTAAYIIDVGTGIQQFDRPCAKIVAASVSESAPYKSVVSCFVSDTGTEMHHYIIDLSTGRFIK